MSALLLWGSGRRISFSISLENDRNLLLKVIAESCPNFKRLNSKDKRVWLMNTEEKSVLTAIATFNLKNMK
jgi:hypothetical protein